MEGLGVEDGRRQNGGRFAYVKRVKECTMVDCNCVVGTGDDAEYWGKGVDYTVAAGGNAQGDHAGVRVWSY